MITADVQKLEPGRKVRVIEVDCSLFGGDVMRFHNDPLPIEGAAAEAATDETLPRSIWWQGQEYFAWPHEIDGIEMNGEGASPTPSLRVANLDGTISALCLQLQDLAQAKVIIHTTFAHYLDAANFAEGNAEADPSQEYVQVWYIDRKTTETGEMVEWQLSSPADLSNRMLPARQVHSMCYWCLSGEYRGPDCGYIGTRYFDADGNPVADPALDQCGGRLSDCKKRFGADAQLPFGGFPAASLVRR